MIKCICEVVVSRAASVTKEVDESGGWDKVGASGGGDIDGEAGLFGVVGEVGEVVAGGLMVGDGNGCVVITVGTGRDLSRRCASVRCVRILLILSECEGVPVALIDGNTLEGVGTTRGAGVAVVEGVTCGVRGTVEGAGCVVDGRGVGCGVGVGCGCGGGMTVTVRGRVCSGVGCGVGVCACADARANAIKPSMKGNIARDFINLNSQG